MPREVVAIDGPAGAGKSTVAKALAAALGFTYLDTGAMYRAVALLAARAGTDDPDAVAKLAQKMDLRFVASKDGQRLELNGEDVTKTIRTPEIGAAASLLSTHSVVRKELVRRQRLAIEAGRVVLEGRDTTTVVCPDARLKVFLTASVEERARRRWLEHANEPDAPSLEEIARAIAERDERDMTREDSPLRVAEDAFVLNTDNLSPDEAVQSLLREWERHSA